MATQQVKTTNFFPHDANARHDEKVIHLRMRHGAAGYGVYFMVLERLREENNYMSVKDYNMIAFDLRVDAAIVKSVVEDFGLFVFTDDGKYFYSESFSRRMNVKDAQRKTRAAAGKAAAQKRWEGKTETEQSDDDDDKQTTPPAPPAKPAAQADNQACLKRFFAPSNQANLETLLINFGLRPDEIPLLHKTAKDIVAEWELQDRPHATYTDWSGHLISLLRIKIKEAKSKNMTSPSPPAPADYDYGGGFGGKDV